MFPCPNDYPGSPNFNSFVSLQMKATMVQFSVRMHAIKNNFRYQQKSFILNSLSPKSHRLTKVWSVVPFRIESFCRNIRTLSSHHTFHATLIFSELCSFILCNDILHAFVFWIVLSRCENTVVALLKGGFSEIYTRRIHVLDGFQTVDTAVLHTILE